MVGLRRGFLATLLVLSVAGATSYGLHQAAGGSPREEWPLLTASADSPDYSPGGDSRIPLWEPLAQPTKIPIGPFWFVVPAGASAVEVFVGPPAVNESTGESPAGALSDESFWVISRGLSRVIIGGRDGQVFLWDVQPEDSADFEDLLRPQPR